jgi:hypothetical protein
MAVTCSHWITLLRQCTEPVSVTIGSNGLGFCDTHSVEIICKVPIDTQANVLKLREKRP